MKTLYIVRHAKSSWKFPELEDHDRPLNKRGKRDAPFMGSLMKSRNVLPELMLSSSANRALTTAKVIAEKTGYDPEKIVVERDIYMADSDDILEILQRQNDKYGSIMIFGHNPGFTDLVNELADEDIDNVPTCGIAKLVLNSESWTELDFGSCELEFFEYPKLYKKK